MFYGQQSPAQDNIHYPPELATTLYEDWSFTMIIIIMDYGFYFHNACVNSQSWRRPSWLKVPTSAFTCKKLLKHYDKRALTQGKWMWNANQPARPLRSFPALLPTSPTHWDTAAVAAKLFPTAAAESYNFIMESMEWEVGSKMDNYPDRHSPACSLVSPAVGDFTHGNLLGIRTFRIPKGMLIWDDLYTFINFQS